jgi:hypothetical protein
MASFGSGHLDCLFDCGLKFSSLESLHLHIEVDHREDNEVSPFLVRDESPPVASSSQHEQVPPLPKRPPPQIPVDYETGQGSRESEHEPYTLCPEPGCDEQILLIELNEHLDLHEAEKIINESSIPEQDNDREQNQAAYSTSSISHASSAAPSPSHIQNFSTDISPALKRKMDNRQETTTNSRVGLGRKFLAMIGIEQKQAGLPSVSRSDHVSRLSVRR